MMKGDGEREVVYTVLYYKRKNKVHKSKGVSKIDGTLTIQETKALAVLMADGDSVIWQGTVTAELAQKGASHELFDQIISVGPFEVEILSVLGNTTASLAKTVKPIIYQRGPIHGLHGPLRSTSGTIRKILAGNRPPSLVSTNIVSSRSKSSLLPSSKRSRLHSRKLPPQSKKAKAFDNDDEEESDSDTPLTITRTQLIPSRVGTNSIKKSTFSVARPRTTLPSFQPPTKLVCTPSASNTALPLVSVDALKRDRPAAVGGSTAAVARGSKADVAGGTFFPGAIGNLTVPHCIKQVLRPHQVEGVTFLWNCLTGNGKVAEVSPHCIPIENEDEEPKMTYKGCILGDAMGLGKSLMTIAAICALHKQSRDKRFVVVCPSSLVKNWAQEFDKWIGKASQPKRVIIKGGEEGIQQMKAFSVVKPKYQSEVLILSYDLFRLNQDCLKDIKKVGLLVVDEGHRLKNTGGSLTMTALESLDCEARLCITATPIQNNLSDMFTIINFVCPGVLGDLATFRKEYERPIAASSNRNCTPTQKQRGTQAAQLLDRITKSLMIRRLQKDVLEKYLPPRNEFLLFCRPTTEQCKFYKKITNKQRAIQGSSAGPSPEALTALMGLRKICTHPHLWQQGADDVSTNKEVKYGILDVELSGKLKVLSALLRQIRAREPTDKVVIVSNFTATLSTIENSILNPAKLNFIRLDGSTVSANRQSLVDTFNRTTAQIHFAMTLSSKAGGVGLNLIGANRIVLVDPDWNPSTDIQAMARIYRQGQKKPCFVYRMFTSGTIEEVICQRQMKKGSLVDLTVDCQSSTKGKGSNRLNAEELRDCFTLKESCSCDTKNKVGDWPDYDGEMSLVSQQCSDSALVALAGQESVESSSLAFVHIVKSTNASANQSDVNDDSDDDGEAEFDMDFSENDEKDCYKGDAHTSEEEFEFE